jgi:16S rRNA processing protein RimM
MEVKDCFCLGVLTRTHGLKGELRLHLYTDTPERYSRLKELYLLINNTLMSRQVRSVKPIAPDAFIVALAGVSTIEEAQKLCGTEVYLPLSKLPTLGEKTFYYHEIIGFTVVDKQTGEIGRVLKVLEMPAQDVLVINYDGVEVMAPITNDFIERIDRTARILYTNLPAGLVDVYTKPTSEETEV